MTAEDEQPVPGMVLVRTVDGWRRRDEHAADEHDDDGEG